VKPLLASFRYALQGLVQVCKTERNMKIHLAAAMIALALSGFLRLSWYEFLFIALAVSMLIMAEGFNTAIEKVVDLVSPDHHPLAGMAKDISAGSVLVAVIFAVVVGVVIFGRRILGLFG